MCLFAPAIEPQQRNEPTVPSIFPRLENIGE
jgi:hypothetical protein